MISRAVALSLFVLVGFAIGGCVMTEPTPQGYAPYDSETNPACGALGTCEPTYTRPYAMRSNPG
jgi:hypothetical protein